jgi:hypothetical protein
MIEKSEVDIASVGSITFDNVPTHLPVRRTASGFRLTIPCEIKVSYIGKHSPRPMLSNLWGILSAKDSSGSVIELGRLQDDMFYSGAHPENVTPGEMIWSDTLSALAFYERIRKNKQPEFQIDLHVELCYLITNYTVNSDHEIRTGPSHKFKQVGITYPVTVWDEMLETLLSTPIDDPILLLSPLSSFLAGKKL